VTDNGQVSISQEMLPQPPPNAETTPPSEAALLSRRKWRWLLGVGGFSVILVVLILLAPKFLRRGHNRDDIEAMNNARQIGLALFEFETEYGKYPDATTIAAVQKETGTLLPLGRRSSNEFFRQLIATGISSNEVMFFAKTQDTLKPDGLIDGGHAIEKRECGFTYFLGATFKDNPNRPILVTPMIPGTDRFDTKIHKGKAVILKLDYSVMLLPIDKHGHVLVAGRNLMDPHHPIWDGHAPVIAWPEF
jgi:hypothetical protein